MKGDYVRTINNTKQFEKKSLAEKLSRTLYIIIDIQKNKHQLKNAENGNIIKKLYQLRDIHKVTKPNTLIEKVDKPKNMIRKMNKSNIKQGHEIQSIDEKGNVTFKKRLQPQNTKR
jgi:hypothetical protein